MAGYKDKLADMQDMWNDGCESLGLPESLYVFVLQDCSLTEAKSSGNMMIRREHMVLEGEYKDEVQTDNMVLSNERSMFYLKKWIELMGFEAPDDFEDIEELIAEIRDAHPVYSADVVKSKDSDFVNVRCKELIAETFIPDDDDAADEPDPPKKGKGKGKGKPKPKCKPKPKKAALAKGDWAKWEDDEMEVVGTVTSIGEDDDGIPVADIDDDKGDTWELPLSELVKIDDPNGADDDEPEDEPDEPDDEPEDEPDRAQLIEFCESADIEVPEGADVASIVSEISQYAWTAKQLVEAEVELLVRHKIPVTGAKKKKAAPKKGKGKGKGKGKPKRKPKK